MKYYYTNAANHILGPVDEADLQAMVAGGEVLPETHIVKENDTTWQPYCEIFPTDPYEAVHPLHRGEHPGQTSTAPVTRFRAVHISRNGEQEGPYSAEQLEERFRSGTIPGDAFYWHEGCEDWLPVREHPDFAPPLPTTFDILRMAHAVCLPPPSLPPPLPRTPRLSASPTWLKRDNVVLVTTGLIMMIIAVAFAVFMIATASQYAPERSNPSSSERTPSRPEPVPSAAASPAPTTSSSLDSAPQDPAPPALATLSPAPETSPEPVRSAPAAQETSPPPLLARPSSAPETSPEPVRSAVASPAPSLPVVEAPSVTSPGNTSCSVVGVPEGDALNVHTGPNSKSQIVAKLPNGYPDAQVIGQPVMNGKTEWVEIKFGDGTGWVTTKYLSRLPSDGTDAARTTPAPTPPAAGPLLRLKLFEDEAHTCRLLLPEDGWVPIESPPRGVSLAVEGPGGIRLGVRHMDDAVGERSLAVLFAREVKERFPFDDMQITAPKNHSTKGARTILNFSAHSSDPMQQMLQNMPDGPMKQGMLAGGAAAGPNKFTMFDWSVISEGFATWVVEVENTITLESPAEIKSKMDHSRDHLLRENKVSRRDFETNPVAVYGYIWGGTIGNLELAMEVSSFDADGLTPVIDLDKQAADPKVTEHWNLIMDALTW